MTTKRRPYSRPRRQRGVSTLIIALLLLGILTVITLFAAAVGVFEQRTSANDYRYKLAFQAAEAGLNQSIEYLKANTQPMLSDASGGWLPPSASARWEPCTVPATIALDPCLAEADESRRASMYRYVGATAGVLPLSEALPGGVSQTFTATGGSAAFPTRYESYATLCRLDLSTPTPECSLAPTSQGTFYVTVVARGSLTDESAQATVRQSFGTYRLFGGEPDAPLIAAGTAVALGNAHIIPNPDGGGFGIPISIWSKGDAVVDAGGTFASCHLGEWLANYGNTPPSAADLVDGVCSTCSCNGLCPGYGLISGDASSCGLSRIEGEDILDRDLHVSHAGLRDHQYFPDDLFAYIFGVPSTVAEDFLNANASIIGNCGALGPGSSGLYWYNQTGTCQLGSAVGSLQNPVVLVSDGPVQTTASNQFFGIVYVRDKSGESKLLQANGSPQIYGSVILEGNAGMSGSPTIIYNKTVLRNIYNSPRFTRYGPIPGSWSDDF